MVIHTLSSIKKDLNIEGYVLLSNCYRWDKKIKYSCPNGHINSMFYNKWVSGRRCPDCYGNKKLSLSYIKKEFEKEGYTVLSNNYLNSRTKIIYKCPNGHIHGIRWNHWHSAGARCPTCKIINMSGPYNFNWKGGISCEPYCDIWLDKDFKESIKERDNYTCQNPDCWGTSEKLTIHHINYDKQECSPFNLITLCNSCNARANTNRYYWEKLYKDLVGMRDGSLTASQNTRLMIGKGQGV